tara:strand:- start:468 stop:971 length:504 start_codon:yes stop_codon:yes gene_type:complete
MLSYPCSAKISAEKGLAIDNHPFSDALLSDHLDFKEFLIISSSRGSDSLTVSFRVDCCCEANLDTKRSQATGKLPLKRDLRIRLNSPIIMVVLITCVNFYNFIYFYKFLSFYIKQPFIFTKIWGLEAEKADFVYNYKRLRENSLGRALLPICTAGVGNHANPYATCR